jgi:hypothetical protein
MLARRLPTICIDEFQDTGHFLWRAVLKLFAEPGLQRSSSETSTRNASASPASIPGLFDAAQKLVGAKTYPPQISQRCATRVCAVASGLSRSGAMVLPTETAATGGAVLAKHADDPAALEVKILEHAFTLARDGGCAKVAALVRKRVTKAKFLRSAAKGAGRQNSFPRASTGIVVVRRKGTFLTS